MFLKNRRLCRHRRRSMKGKTLTNKRRDSKLKSMFKIFLYLNGGSNMKKKILALSMATVLAMSMFTGCGSSTENKSSKDTLVIGGLGPITGEAAIYGQAVKNGIKLAVDEINEAGGVNGMKLEFVFQDDENDGEKSVNAYNKLKDSGAKILIGATTSSCSIAVSEKTKEDNMFQLTPSGSAVDCVKYDNVFRVCFNDPNQGLASAQYISQNKIGQKVAVIYDSSDVYSTGIYEKFIAEAKNQNLEVVSELAFTKDTNTDFSVQIQKVQESGADLVFLPIYYQQAAKILSQADKAGLDVKYFGCDGLDGLIGQLGDDVSLADGVMLLTPFAADAKDEKSQAFVKAYKEAFNNETPIQFAADAYDAVYAVKAAIEKAGVNDGTISTSSLCEKLKSAMTEIEISGVTGDISWSADGEPTKTPKGMVIEDGSYKALD